MSEFRFPRGDQWEMTHIKRAWVPEWLYRMYSYLPAWLEPFRWIFNRRIKS